VARDLLLSIESETRAAELGKRILAAAQGGKSLEDAVKETLAAAIPAPVEKKDKKGDRKPEKKGDKKGDETADEKKEARGPLDQPDAPHVEVANDVSPEGAGPLPGVEIPAQVSPLKKPGDLVPDLIKLEAGYAVLQLIERKAPSKEAFEKERVRFTQALLAAKQHDALFAYVQRLREVAKNDIKVNAAYLTDKAPAEEPSE
jgi:peptidyl-prolyl cis-trans isomerase D